MTNGAIEFALDCPHALLRDLYEGARRSRDNMYFCGVLFGRRTGPVVRIEAWRGDATGAGHWKLLKNVDGEAARVESVLAQAAADAALDGLTPVGWFVARREGELAPQPPELELYSRFFPEPWQVTLLVRPDRERGAARFFRPGAAAGDALGVEANAQNTPRARRRPTPRALLWSLGVGGWLLLAALGIAAWLQPGVAAQWLPSPAEIPLRLAADAEGLTLNWDHYAVRALGVWRATVDVHTAGSNQHYELSKDEITSGMLRTWTPASDTAIEMVFYPDTGKEIHSYTRFLLPAAPPPAPPALTNHPGQRTAGTGVQALGHAPREVR